MKRIKSTAAVIFVVGSAACSDTPRAPTAQVETVIEGELFGASVDGELEVYDYQAGIRGERLCRSDAERTWRCPLGPLSGTVLVEWTRASGRLFSLVPDLELGETRDQIPVTAVTHLESSYVAFRVASGLDLQAAQAEARPLFEDHFGALPHTTVPPSLEADSAGAEGVRIATLLFGLEALAQQLSVESGNAGDSVLTEGLLIERLSEDVRADGVFDGQGRSGVIRFGLVPLSGSTLRTEYARALLSWLETEANETGFGVSDWRPIAEEISSRQSRLFPSDPAAPLDDSGPTVDAITITRGDGQPVIGGLISHSVTVRATVSDLTGVASVAMSMGSDRRAAMPAAGGYVAVLDTRMVPDGPVTLTIEALDVLGNLSTTTSTMGVDNTPPAPSIVARADRDTGELIVLGTVTDESAGVLRTELLIGTEHFTFEGSEASTVELFPDIQCDEVQSIRVRSWDLVDNLAEEILVVDCTQLGLGIQLLPTSYVPEDTFELEPGIGGQPQYFATPASRPMLIDESSDWPIELTKYVTRLDEPADNLPKLRLLVGAGAETADYRYLIDGEEMRGWTALTSVAGGIYELVLSYQALAPALGRARAGALHTIEVRTGAGAESQIRVFGFTVQLLAPPVWIGGCGAVPNMANFTLPAGSLHGFYQSQTEQSVFQGDLVFAPGVAPSSLAPVSGIELELSDGLLRSEVTEVWEDRHDGPGFTLSPDTDLSAFCPYTSHYYEGPGFRRYETPSQGAACPLGDLQCALAFCVAGLKPLQEVLWTPSDGTTLSGVNPDFRASRSSLWRSGVEVPTQSSGLRRLDADEAYRFVARSSVGAFRVLGQDYDWPVSFELPPGYASGFFPSRYRLTETFTIYGATGVNKGVDPQRPYSARAWALVPYIAAFTIDLEPPAISARLRDNPDVSVQIRWPEACRDALHYETRL